VISNKKKLKLIQEAYDMGYAHGLVDGKDEKHVEIVQMLTKKLDGTDWLQEDPLRIHDVVPLVKGELPTNKNENVWG
jgi:hypothetical protein